MTHSLVANLDDACPDCGEMDIDELVFVDDGEVECQTCMCIYTPPSGGDYSVPNQS